MSIWYYSTHRDHDSDADMAYRTDCLYCDTPLNRDVEDEQKVALYEELNYGFSDNFRTRASATIGICPACGWWKYGLATTIPPLSSEASSRAHYVIRLGSLKRLDVANPETPINEIRDYLTARFDSRFNVHPRLFEDVVASIFREHGYSARGGIFAQTLG